MLLYRLGLVTHLRRAREDDLAEALAHMVKKHAHHHDSPKVWGEQVNDNVDDLPVWTVENIGQMLKDREGRCIVAIGQYVVDATAYLAEHVHLSVFIGLTRQLTIHNIARGSRPHSSLPSLRRRREG